MINGLFGAGGGLLCVFALKNFTKLEDKQSHATVLAIILPLTLISIVIYSFNGNIDFITSLPYIIGGIAGAPAGAWLLSKLPTGIIKKIFAVIIIITSIKMLF